MMSFVGPVLIPSSAYLLIIKHILLILNDNCSTVSAVEEYGTPCCFMGLAVTKAFQSSLSSELPATYLNGRLIIFHFWLISCSNQGLAWKQYWRRPSL